MFRIFALSLLIFLFSCSDDSGTGPGDNIIPGTLKVDIDGTQWNATPGAVISSISIVETQGTLGVTAAKSISSSQSQSVTIGVSASATNPSDLKGTYTLSATETATVTFLISNTEGVTYYYATSGQVKINKITDANVSGEFNAICVNIVDQEDTITMANGSFNAIIANP